MTLDVDVFVVDDDRLVITEGHAPKPLPPNGYRVTGRGVDRPFRCHECVCSDSPPCSCIHEALAYARLVGPGAQVMRGDRVLAFVSQRTYAEALAGAEATNTRAARKAGR